MHFILNFMNIFYFSGNSRLVTRNPGFVRHLGHIARPLKEKFQKEKKTAPKIRQIKSQACQHHPNM